MNFSPTAGKATEKDRTVYEKLKTFRCSATDDSELYTNLKDSAADVTGKNVLKTITL